MENFKFTVTIPRTPSQPNNNDKRRIIIKQDNAYEGLNIEQAMFLKVVLESWINSVGENVVFLGERTM